MTRTTTDERRPAELPVRTELRDRVLWVHLSRPAALNAIDDGMVAGLDEALDRAAAPDVRAVVVRGSGRAFCVGVDLKQVAGDDLDMGVLTAMVRRIGGLVERLAALPKPTVAGVNGVTAAGGLEIVLACDLVVAARSARLADAHSNYGLLPGAGATPRLVQAAGPRLAKRLMFSGEFVSALDLVPSGVVNEVVDDDELDQRLDEIGRTLSARSPRVLAAMKRLVDATPGRTLSESLAAEFAELEAHTRTPDLVEGLRAFREGRAPSFADDVEPIVEGRA